MTIGQKIRWIRRGLGWYQHELASAVGVEPPTVSRWENDEMLPSPKMLIKIAEALIKPPDFFEEDSKEPEDIPEILARLEKLEESQENHKQSDQEKELLSLFRKVNDVQRDEILFYIRGITRDKSKPVSGRKRL